MSRILVLTAHRTPDESRINKALIAALSPLPNVTVHELIRATRITASTWRASRNCCRAMMR